jgi:hypothetical protein
MRSLAPSCLRWKSMSANVEGVSQNGASGSSGKEIHTSYVTICSWAANFSEPILTAARADGPKTSSVLTTHEFRTAPWGTKATPRAYS